MGVFEMHLPDIGEGITEAEVAEWHVKPGDLVKEDDVLAAVMTDKAAVEVPSIVDGRVLDLACEVGESLAIGAILVRIETEGEGAAPAPETPAPAQVPETAEKPAEPAAKAPTSAPPKPANPAVKPLAAPSVRAKAREAGIDLRHVPGSGPGGRILHDDIEAYIASGQIRQGSVSRAQNTGVEEIRVVGMRRKIAEKMALAKRQIPHITIVEEVEMQALEDLRSALNAKYEGQRPKLTLLPFLVRAIVTAVRESPEMNARFDDEAGVIHRFGGVHLGVATQTPNGLTVPVLRHAEASSLWEAASEILRLSEDARNGTIKRDDLTGGTITISSLGPLGAIASTPIINYPEVAIVGVNKMQVRPVWDGHEFRPRKMMNLSSAFDHRVIDGWDAAVFVARLKELLETPAMLFVEG